MRRQVTRALTAADWVVHQSPFEPLQLEAETRAGRDLFIVDADEDPVQIVRFLDLVNVASSPRAPTLLLSQESGSRLVVDLLSERGLNNVVARHAGVSSHQELIDESELMVTCQKLLTRDIFGLDKYLTTWGVKLHHRHVRSVDDKYGAVNALEAFLVQIDCFGGVIPAISLVCEELLMNAIFNAPCNPDGSSKYGSRDRADMLVLEPSEGVDFRFGCDGRYVGLSVVDAFGSLTRPDIVRYLEQCFIGNRGQIENKQGGAGLGLYMVFNSITQLVFNIHAGKRTEVIALFYVRSGARAFRRSGRSLNIFMLDD